MTAMKMSGHDVADTLSIVEGLAFAQQVDVEFFPRVTGEALGQEFGEDARREIAAAGEQDDAQHR
jgi:hypothetical protein